MLKLFTKNQTKPTLQRVRVGDIIALKDKTPLPLVESLRGVKPQNKLILLLVCLVIVLGWIGTSFHSVVADVAAFYPQTCLGSWQNPKNAEGRPFNQNDSSEDEFTESNSALVKNDAAQIFCGGFAGSIPTDSQPKKVIVSFSLAIKSLKSLEEQVQASSSADTILESSSTSSDKIILESLLSTSTIIELFSDQGLNATSAQQIIDLPIDDVIISVHLNEDDTTVETISTKEDVVVPETNNTPSQTIEESVLNSEVEQAEVIDNAKVEVNFNQDSNLIQPTQNNTESSNGDDDETSPVSLIKSLFFEKVFASTTNEELDMEFSLFNSDATSSLGQPEPEVLKDVTDSLSISTQVVAGDNSTTTDLVFNYDDSIIEVKYTIDGEVWNILGKISASKYQNVEFEIPSDVIAKWSDLSNLQISLQTLPTIDEPKVIFLDAIKLSVNYENLPKEQATTTTDGVKTVGHLILNSAISKTMKAKSRFETESGDILELAGQPGTNLKIYDIEKEGAYFISAFGDDPVELPEYFLPPGNYTAVNTVEKSACAEFSLSECRQELGYLSEISFTILQDNKIETLQN